jgi:hypothetical protein
MLPSISCRTAFNFAEFFRLSEDVEHLGLYFKRGTQNPQVLPKKTNGVPSGEHSDQGPSGDSRCRQGSNFLFCIPALLRNARLSLLETYSGHTL